LKQSNRDQLNCICDCGTHAYCEHLASRIAGSYSKSINSDFMVKRCAISISTVVSRYFAYRKLVSQRYAAQIYSLSH